MSPMFRVTSEQIKTIKVAIGYDLGHQQKIFDTLNYNPYADDADDEFGGAFYAIAMERDDYNSRREEMLEDLAYWGVCDEERAAEILAGAAATAEEDQKVDDNLFEEGDTFMVINKYSDGIESLFGVIVTMSMGQNGIGVRDFLGFYGTVEDAESAISAADYVLYQPS